MYVKSKHSFQSENKSRKGLLLSLFGVGAQEILWTDALEESIGVLLRNIKSNVLACMENAGIFTE